MAKFEANIPSYLKSGAGSVPIDNNFDMAGGSAENLSQVIDNYNNNFSTGVKTPANTSMPAPDTTTNMAPIRMPEPKVESNADINPLDLQSIIKPEVKVAEEPTIPSDEEIKDILIA